MTDSTSQPSEYPSAEQQAAQQQAAQQQAAAAQQQQQQAAYAAQQQQQQQQQHTGQHPYPQQTGYVPAPGSQFLDKLPMDVLTLSLAVGGLLAMFVGQLVAGADAFDSTNLFVSGSVLTPTYAILILTAITITTTATPKLHGVFRTIVLGLAVLEFGNTLAGLINAGSTAPAAAIIAAVFYIIAVGLFAAATFTAKKPTPSVPAGYPQQQQGWQ